MRDYRFIIRLGACAGALIGSLAAFPIVTAGQPARGPRAGDPLRGLGPAELARFEAGRAGFEAIEGVEDGIGPVFNDLSCAACHNEPATGGGSNDLDERSVRFGRITGGLFDDMKGFGGPTVQKRGIGPAGGVDFVGEVVPPEATIVSRRRSTALFGLGLVDAVPDRAFHELAAAQRANTPEVAGRPSITRNLRTGQPAVGKFGWKAQFATIFDFTGDAYKDEMGITVAGFTDPGAPGVVFPFHRTPDDRHFAEESPPQGDASLLLANPVGSPNEPDDEDLILFTDFITFLAPPPRGPIGGEARQGEVVFRGIGCAACHLPSLQTGPNPVRALNYARFQPYSDFLLHDMGPLGDGIGGGEGPGARGSEMRTPPLWGLRELQSFLHDGRAETVEEAIRMHEGQGRGARDRFAALPERQRQQLLAFLGSL